MKQILALYDKIGDWRVRLPRMIDSMKELKLKKGNIPIKKMTSEEILMVKSFWGKLKPNKKYIKLYNAFNDDFKPNYIPDDMYYAKIDTYFNNGVDCFALDDKNLYDLYFFDVEQPKTIARKYKDVWLDSQYHLIEKDNVIKACLVAENVVVKKATCSNGGKNIYFWNINDGIEKLKEIFVVLSLSKDNYLIQEKVLQHGELAKCHPNSLNTIRILSLLHNNKVYILSTIVRMGANGSLVDNGHSGGIFCGVETNGQFKNVAYTYMTGKRFKEFHPTTKIRFSDCKIPNYEKCLEVVMELAPRLCRISRLTSWDLTVTKDCKPCLIEVNLSYGGVFFHQIANGPVFGDLTESVLNEVFGNYKK